MSPKNKSTNTYNWLKLETNKCWELYSYVMSELCYFVALPGLDVYLFHIYFNFYATSIYFINSGGLPYTALAS